jgi:inosine-uridine nucleoside N-ribohydrolase
MNHRFMRYALPTLISFMLSFPLVVHASETTSGQDKLKILIDTDPGVDDAFAIFWLMSLAKQGFAEIDSVTTIGGNVVPQKTFLNASRVLALGGFAHVEIARAARSDYKCLGGNSEGVFGDDGLGGLAMELPESPHNYDKARKADDLIIEKLNATPGEITIVSIGPLTNLASAEEKSPGILAKAKEVVIMGGAFRYRGNMTSHAEFNIHCDPNSAQTVFKSRNDIVILPLDASHKILVTEEQANSILETSPNSKVAQFIKKFNGFMVLSTLSSRDSHGIRGFLVHDASVLFYLFYPETLINIRRAEVNVETQGQFSMGQTLIDDRHFAKPKTNSWIVLDVDEVNMSAILVEDLKTLVLLDGSKNRD